MAPKVFMILGVLLALVLLISAEVATKDLSETSTLEKEKENELENAKYGGYQGVGNGDEYGGGRGGNGGKYGDGRGGYNKKCPYYCCTPYGKYKKGCYKCYC